MAKSIKTNKLPTSAKLPAGWSTPNDSANLLCQALNQLKYTPKPVSVVTTDGPFDYLGIDLEGEHLTLFLQMLGGEILSVIASRPEIQRQKSPRSMLVTIMQDLGLPMAHGLTLSDGETLPDDVLPKGHVVWIGIPLIRAA